MPTLLCVPILVHDEAAAMADALAARDAGADLVEFRIDEFFTGSTDSASGELDDAQVKTVLRLVAGSPLPCIVTCRSATESGGVGGYGDDEMARVSLYERLGTAASVSDTRSHAPGSGELKEHPPRYLDFEYAAYTRSANIRQKISLGVTHPAQVRRDVTTGLILSTHDFDSRPVDLTRRVLKMQQEPAASVVKFAFRARSLRDNLEVFDLLQDNRERGEKPMIGLAMGEFGLMSRVLAPKFGGFLTFASLRKASTTAPGQPTVRELIDLYRFRSIKPATKVYGVIGSPAAVAHSLSPLVHNAGFEAIGWDGVYLPLPIAADDSSDENTYLSFKATLDALLDHEGLGLAGASVTMPFKEALCRWASWDTHAEGSANTLLVHTSWDVDSHCHVDRVLTRNTDSSAVRALLDAALGHLSGKTVGVVGAGGVARAAVWACASRGANVCIFNRRPERAQALADRYNQKLHRGDQGRVSVEPLDALRAARADAVINCTSLGMRGGKNEQGHSTASDLAAPVAEMLALPEHCVFFDTVYNPVDTPMLRAARERGFRTIDGVSMFVEQAAAQFTLWTGQPAPKALFERICREALSVEK